MNNQKKIILNPKEHKAGVELFFEHFNLKQQSIKLGFLQEILSKFSNFPYENLSKIIKLAKNFQGIDNLRYPEEIFDDYARLNLGGTCFSLTFFLYSILLHNDFECYPVIASMYKRPFCHCAMVVFVDGQKYLVDPGYLLTHPIKLDKDNPRFEREDHTVVELRFDPATENYNLFTINNNNQKWRYVFADQPVSMPQFYKYWHDSFYKNTMLDLCLTKVSENGVIYFHRDFAQTSNAFGKTKKRFKESEKFIHDTFHIDFQTVEQAQDALKTNIVLGRETGLVEQINKEYKNESE